MRGIQSCTQPGRSARRRAAAVAALLAVALPATVHPARPAERAARDGPCDAALATPAAPGPSRDLYCIELVPAPGIAAAGRVELGHPPGPFAVAVTADGRPRHALAITLADLPAPATLGPFTTYVAWAATPLMHPVVRLGAVGEGRARLPTIDLDRFVILVTAEASADVAEPTGRIVLRGQSPSMRLQPPDLLQFVLGAVRDTAPHAAHGAPAAPAHAHGADALLPAAGAAAARWTTVPAPPGISMLPAEMALRPDVSPWLPRPAGRAPPPLARPREVVRLATGDTLRLAAGPVRRAFKGRELTMYGFNGQYPGPLLQVGQGAEVVVDFENALDQPTTVHWHGVRLDNRFDGVPGLTQDAVPPGGRFVYRVRFPDAGLYWYHPHVREDVQQELGLYGNILVRSPRPDHWGPAHREEVLMLDDLLLGDDGDLVPFGREAATHALMGRFGNVLLVNGEPRWEAAARRGEVVRLLLTNVSNARTLNLSFVGTDGRPGARLKVVAADVGSFAREAWVESVVIAPAERYVVHARFDAPGEVALVNRVQAIDHVGGRFLYATDTLGVVRVATAPAPPGPGARFDALRADRAAAAEIDRYRRHFAGPPDRTLVLTLETRDLPLLTRQLMQLDSAWFAPVEWTGSMPHMNWASTSAQVRWIVRDPATGAENMDVAWTFRRGDVIRLRLASERRAFHAMQHPIHIHGQRFLVLAVNGVASDDLAWKDTVLVPAGGTVDLLLELSNPGRWMLHCHIAEHLTADMMMAFTVR